MFGSSARSDFVPASTRSFPGVGTYTLAAPPGGKGAGPSQGSSQRADLVPASSRGGSHAYSSQFHYAPPPPWSSASPPFGTGGPRSDSARPGTSATPGPGAYTLARPSTSPLCVYERSTSPSPLGARARTSPTVPYAPGEDTTPGPGAYAPRPVSPGSPGANLFFSYSRAPKHSPLSAADPTTPGPGSTGNPMLPADAGQAYKAAGPAAAFHRPSSPTVEALGRGASLRLPTRDNPGPADYLGPWGASGFLKAAAHTPEGLPHTLGTRASREFIIGHAPPGRDSPSPAAYNTSRARGGGGGGGVEGGF